MAKKSPTKTISKLNLGAPVSQLVELNTIFIVESSARRKLLRGELPPGINLSVDVETDVDKGQGIVQVRPRFELIARYDETASGELLRIAAIFLLQYRLASFEGLTKANFNAFGEMNGLYNAWPYWREFVQATTVRMGLPTITIPVYRPMNPAEPAKRVASSKRKPAKRIRKPRMVKAPLPSRR